MKATTLRRHYKKHSSGFQEWSQKEHAKEYMLFPENVGEFLSIDEVAMSQGELYTFVTNKNGRGKKGTLLASIKGTKTGDILNVLNQLSIESRSIVKEVTLDMAKNMEAAVKEAFPEANLVTDRFHVVKLILDSVQHLRVKYRWEELEKENKAIAAIRLKNIELKKKEEKEKREKYISEELDNGDTRKQLLARSRYILAKKKSDWTENQAERAKILFNEYPELEKAYNHVIEFRSIYEHNTKASGRELMTKWIANTQTLAIEEFNTAANTVQNNIENILNFFTNRNTNANAESFNSKIKLFRANLRGVTDTTFFLFRMKMLFA